MLGVGPSSGYPDLLDSYGGQHVLEPIDFEGSNGLSLKHPVLLYGKGPGSLCRNE